jgi:hypothetical protein
VFHLSSAVSQTDLQEIATILRLTGDIRYCFTYPAARAIALRGAAEQAAMAEWLIRELDRPGFAGPAASPEYSGPGQDDVVRVFRLAPSRTPEDLVQIATRMRVTISLKRIYALNSAKLLTVRGTRDQLAAAERMASAGSQAGQARP